MSMAYAHAVTGAGSGFVAPRIRHIGLADIRDALRLGWEDFAAIPSHAVFLCLIYPLIGFLLGWAAFGYRILPLLYPMITGFALVGPIAGLGLYELSRRREQGEEAVLTHAFDILRSPSRWAIALLALMLVLIFCAWLVAAQGLYWLTLGDVRPESLEHLLRLVFGTNEGWTLIVAGNLVGFLFAALVLVISVFSFPLLIDHHVGAADAVLTSVRAVQANPVMMALWGLIVAVVLFVGAVPLFLGLTVAVPVLGHATWHLYRKAIDAEALPRQEYIEPSTARRSAADFPVALFTPTRDEP
jgi:uncharacterized membrane protein